MQKAVQFIFRILGGLWPKLGGRLAYLLFFKPFRVKLRPRELETKRNGTTESVVINKKKSFFTTWGDGPTVIFAHGWSSKGLHYHKFVEPLLQRGYQVVIPDFPAHVASEGKTTNVLEFKAMLLYLMDKSTDLHGLVGHSLGGMAAILSLLEYPKKLEKLVIVNSAIWSDTIMQRYMDQIGGNNRIKKALHARLRKHFGQDFEYYSTANRILDIKQLPDVMVVVDNNDADVPLEEGRELTKRVDARLLITHKLGHNRGLKDDNVVAEIVEFLTKKNRA